jgi:spore coat protein H
VNHYLKTLATEIIIGHWDGHAFNKNNFYLYRQPSNGKFIFIEYDLDNSFGIDWFGIDWANRDLNDWHETNRPLVERLLDVPYYKDVFNAHLDTMLSDLDTSSWYSVLAAKQNLIKSAVLSDTYYRKDYGFQYSDFLVGLDDNYGAHVKNGLAEYLDERITSGLGQIDLIGNLEPACDELTDEPARQIVKIVDFIGRETLFRTDIPLIIMYDDGTAEKVMVWGN